MKAIKDLAVIFLILITSCVSIEGSTKQAVVVAPSGASLRSGTGTQTKKLATIPAYSTVDVLEFTFKEDTIEGITAPWVKVRWDNKEGYVFEGLLGSPEEIQLIKSLGKKVARELNKLKITADNGKVLVFEDFLSQHQAENIKIHRLTSYIPEHHLYVIDLTYYEGGVTLIVNSVDGRTLQLDIEPVFSSDGQKFVTANYDLEAGYTPNRIQIYDFSDGLGKLEWSNEPDTWGPLSAEWISNSKIKFKTNSPSAEQNTEGIRYLNYDPARSSWLLSE